MTRILAVLDTSFWIAAYCAEFVANCLDLFDIEVFRNCAGTRLLIETLESPDLRLPAPTFDPRGVRIV